MVYSATQQTMERSFTRGRAGLFRCQLHNRTSTSPRVTSRQHHLNHHHNQATVGLFGTAEHLRRQFSTSTVGATAATANMTTIESGPSTYWTSLKGPVHLDRPFLDMVRQRLEDKDDTSAYFMHCKEEPVRQAGVLMPLCIYKGVPSVLFTIRASHMRNHRGEVSFPGGKRDPTDKTVLDTALREMEEEIFITRDKVEVLGECASLPNKGCTMKVHPFVGYLKEPIEDLDSIKFNKDEVQRVFTVPLQDLLDPGKRSMVQFRASKFLYPVWKVDQEDITIWGLTAFIIDGVLRRIAKEGPAQAIEIPEGAKAERYRPPKPSA